MRWDAREQTTWRKATADVARGRTRLFGPEILKILKTRIDGTHRLAIPIAKYNMRCLYRSQLTYMAEICYLVGLGPNNMVDWEQFVQPCIFFNFVQTSIVKH